MKKSHLFFLVVIFFSTVPLSARGGGQSSAKFINIASGGTSGTYYPLAGAMAEIWNKNLEGANVTAQTSGASVANVNLMREGSVEIIFVQNDIAYYAYKGEEAFKDNPYSDIRGMAALYPETIQIVTLADRGINSLQDLKGQRVGVGAAGSGTEANARQVLEAAGLSYDDIKEQFLSFSEVSANLKDGNVDVGFTTAGFPTANIQDIAAQRNLVQIAIPNAVAQRLMSKYSFYTPITIPAGTYGDSPAVATVAVKAMLAVRGDVPEDTVYQMLQSLYANLPSLRAAHKKGNQISKANGKEGISIPLHPGAVRFFEG